MLLEGRLKAGHFVPSTVLLLDLLLHRCRRIISIIKGSWYDSILIKSVVPAANCALQYCAIRPEWLGNVLVMTRNVL